MKIFVTGCAGLLGANYTRHLIQNGHHVVGIDDLSGGHKAFITKGENFEFVKLNLEREKKSKHYLSNTNLKYCFILLRMQLKDYLLLFVIIIIVTIFYALQT